MGDSPDINGVCRDGVTLCNSAGCCGTNNGYDTIDFDDGTCTYIKVIYGCLNNTYSINFLFDYLSLQCNQNNPQLQKHYFLLKYHGL